MRISKALAIKILKYCFVHSSFYFPFRVVCRPSTGSDDFIEFEPKDYLTIQEEVKYKNFELWEDLQSLDLETLRLMSKGFIEKILISENRM